MHPDSVTCFYDASCPVCGLEMQHLKRRDVDDKLALVDISAPGFDAVAFGFTAAALDAEMHLVAADGSVVRGMTALRRAYSAVGLGWLLRPTGLPLLRPLFDALYRGFARRRHAISRTLGPLLIPALRASRRPHAASKGAVR